MSTRRYIPPRLQGAGLGAPPGCGPYYEQPHLPLRNGPAGMPTAGGPPADARERFHAFSSITTPVAGTTNQLIVSYTVPNGHSAKVVGLLVRYEGSGFVEGDATLLYFSLRLNGATFVQNYDVIPNTLGSLTAGPWPVPAAIKLSPADLIEVMVTVPGGSTVTTGAPTRCHGHLLGWYEPVGA